MWWISTSRRRISGTRRLRPHGVVDCTVPLQSSTSRTRRDDGLVRGRHVVDQLVPTPAGAELDVGDAALEALPVLGQTGEHAQRGVGVAGDVGEHVPDRPRRELGRCRRIDGGHRAQIRHQPLLRLVERLDVAGHTLRVDHAVICHETRP